MRREKETSSGSKKRQEKLVPHQDGRKGKGKREGTYFVPLCGKGHQGEVVPVSPACPVRKKEMGKVSLLHCVEGKRKEIAEGVHTSLCGRKAKKRRGKFSLTFAEKKKKKSAFRKKGLGGDTFSSTRRSGKEEGGRRPSRAGEKRKKK